MVRKLLVKIAQKLDEYHIDYMVIGGQAVLIHGEPRMTADIDITLAATVDKLDVVEKIVHELGLSIIVDEHHDFVKRTWVLPAYDPKSGFRVDFIFSFSSYERKAIERAVKVKIKGYFVKFASVEDLIIHKIVAGRARDIEDVKVILHKNLNKFDKDYILRQLKEFDDSLNLNTVETFEKILDEIREEISNE